MKLNLGRDSKARFGQDFEFQVYLNLIKICVRTCDMASRTYFGKMNSALGSVVPLAMFDH